MAGQGHAFFGMAAVLVGATFVGTGRNQADGQREELRALEAREAEIKVEMVATHEAWRQALLYWQARGEVGNPPLLRPSADAATLTRVQMRIFELRQSNR